MSHFRSVYIVYDLNLEAYVKDEFAGYPAYGIIADEEHKTIDTAIEICRWLLDQHADRQALVLAVGGGVTTDLAGFAASIYKRGVRYANVATTLLAMVDAAIGGKTGANVDSYKNMIGVIKQPEFTYICPKVLRTLPAREFRSGAAEMLKTFIIEDNGNYQKALEVLSGELDLEAIEPLIKAAGLVKAGIVQKDEFEKDIRRYLNLGHSYGHAVEWWEHTHSVANPLSHGEAVAIGIIKAAELSERLGIAAEGLSQKLIEDFEKCNLPTRIPCEEKELLNAISLDKKAQDGKINFVLIESIGKVIVRKIDLKDPS